VTIRHFHLVYNKCILQYMNKTTEIINVTPTWEHLVPVLAHIIRHSKSASARADIMKELENMAKAADCWNAHCQESK
jgi:ABC-type uncharacterized transport system YnjBCD substrate-binding protein